MSARDGLTEVAGIEYCATHGGILVEGSDLDCQYEETESNEECRGVPLFYGNDR